MLLLISVTYKLLGLSLIIIVIDYYYHHCDFYMPWQKLYKQYSLNTEPVTTITDFFLLIAKIHQ